MMRSLLIRLSCVLALSGCASFNHSMHPAAAADPRLDAYASARATEIGSARRSATDLQAATAALPAARQVRSSVVKTVTRHVIDRKTGQARDVEVFDSMVAEVPIGLLDTPEHAALMAPVGRFARSLAAQRGSATVDRAYASADAPGLKLDAERVTAKASDDKDVTVQRRVAAGVPAGFERVTVRGAEPPTEL